MYFKLLKFEVRRQLKSVIFWICVLTAAYLSIRNEDVESLCSLPVESDQEAVDFIEMSGGESNIYHMLDLWDYDYSKRVTSHIPKDQNPDEFPPQWEGIKASEINEIVKNQIGDVRFSKLFFKIFSVNCIKYFSFFLIFMFPNLLFKDRSSRISSIINTQPIKSRTYISSKFWGNIIPYIGAGIIVFIVIGIYHMPKVVNAGIEFSLYDMIMPFMCFFVPMIIFISTFLLLCSEVFKYPVVSIFLYIFLIMIPTEIGAIPGLVNVKNAITGYSSERHVSIPPIKLYYGLPLHIVIIILSLIFLQLTYYIFEKNKSKV